MYHFAAPVVATAARNIYIASVIRRCPLYGSCFLNLRLVMVVLLCYTAFHFLVAMYLLLPLQSVGCFSGSHRQNSRRALEARDVLWRIAHPLGGPALRESRRRGHFAGASAPLAGPRASVGAQHRERPHHRRVSGFGAERRSVECSAVLHKIGRYHESPL